MVRSNTPKKKSTRFLGHERLYSDAGPSVLGFISKLSVGPAVPHFPTIFGTGFFVDPSGVAATNRHVIEIFQQIRPNPKTGQSSLGAVMFLPEDNGSAWQMLVIDVVGWNALADFSSSSTWYGRDVPDIGFVQLAVRDVPTLKLATENFYLRVGMEIATIGYPMGNLPLTALGKLNQASPFFRHGVVSSVFPCPTARPHGFTIDVMQQGGSSGSPILAVSDGQAIGMMSSGAIEWRQALSPHANLTYSLNTNISIAEPAHIIHKALRKFRETQQIDTSGVLTLAEQRAKSPKPDKDTGLTWDSWFQDP